MVHHTRSPRQPGLVALLVGCYNAPDGGAENLYFAPLDVIEGLCMWG